MCVLKTVMFDDVGCGKPYSYSWEEMLVRIRTPLVQIAQFTTPCGDSYWGVLELYKGDWTESCSAISA